MPQSMAALPTTTTEASSPIRLPPDSDFLNPSRHYIWLDCEKVGAEMAPTCVCYDGYVSYLVFIDALVLPSGDNSPQGAQYGNLDL